MSTPRTSAAALVIANLTPLAGVMLFEWRVLDVLLLYWAENVVIGVINVLRMLVAGGGRYLLIPFFATHYGIFCFGHYLAVTSLFGTDSGTAAALPQYWQPQLWWGVAAIAVSHLLSFALNFIGEEEYLRTNIGELMHRPYGRIVTLHIAVIAGGLLVSLLGNPVWMLIILIAIKIVIDLRLHGRERQIFGMTGAESRERLP